MVAATWLGMPPAGLCHPLEWQFSCTNTREGLFIIMQTTIAFFEVSANSWSSGDNESLSLNFEMTIHYQKYICVEFKRISKKQTISQKRNLQSASCLLKVEVNLAFVCQKHLLNRIVKLHQLKKVQLKIFGISNLNVSKTTIVIGSENKGDWCQTFFL